MSPLATTSTVSLTVAIISGLIAIASLIWQYWTQSHLQEQDFKLRKQITDDERAYKADQLVRRYKEPLVLAADQLQNRINNIIKGGFFQTYGKLEYAVISTSFAIAELFCWMEIVRQDQQFLDLGEETRTKELNIALANISWSFATDKLRRAEGWNPAPFMLWRQDQRAIGEQMIDRTKSNATSIGFARFVAELDDLEDHSWFKKLLEDSRHLAADPERAYPRLPVILAAVEALLEILDPSGILSPRQLSRPFEVNQLERFDARHELDLE